MLEPHGVVDPGDRHLARQLAGLVLCFVAFGGVAIVLELTLVPAGEVPIAPPGLGMGVLGVSYALARGRRWRMGGALLALTPAVVAAGILALDPGDPVAPAFMLLGVAFATLFLRFRQAAAIAVGIFGVTLLLLGLQPELRRPDRAIPLLVLHLVASPCLLLVLAQRQRVEQIRRAALVDDERDRAERERLQAVSRLASNVAHELNNLLSVVRVNTEVLLEAAGVRERPLLEELRVAADRGAALVQSLPRRGDGTEPNTEAPPERGSAPAPPVRAPRSVLVVDDDELVRRLMQRVLEGEGHAVRVAASGAEALRSLESERDTTVMVTDVSMPGMTGPELVERARALAPRLRVLYVSALSERGPSLEGGDGVLAKPFAPQALCDAVASL